MNRLDQRSVRPWLRGMLGVGLGLATLGGCASNKNKPTNQQAAPAELPTGQDLADLASSARKGALEFELTVSDLRNAPLDNQRPQLRNAFFQLADVLPKLAGTRHTGVFEHQYSVVANVRDQLANRPERLRDTGLIDDGLLATYNALRDLSYNEYYADEELGKRLDAFGASVGQLYKSTGYNHAIQVADSMGLASSVLTKMAVTLYERTKDQPNVSPDATTAPATGPAVAPAAPAEPNPAPADATPPAPTPADPTPAPAPSPTPAPSPEAAPPTPPPAGETPAPTPSPEPAAPAPTPPAESAPPAPSDLSK